MPTNIDGIPLTWKYGNYATIPGLLDEINKYMIRKALLQPLKHGVRTVGHTRSPTGATAALRGRALGGLAASAHNFTWIMVRVLLAGSKSHKV